MNPRRLYRSVDDRWIAGVAAGVADYFDVDPILVRIIWLISVPLTGFVSAVAYFIMMIVVPLGPQEWSQPSPWQPGGAPVGYGAAGTPPAAPGAPDAPPAGAAPGAPQGAPMPGPVPGWDWRWQARQDRWQRRAERWERRAEHRGSGGVVFGALLIVVGAVLAWHTIDPGLDLNLAWAVAIVAFGVFLVISSIERRGGA
jgi:phage shock protein C